MMYDNDNNGLRFLSVCSGIEAASVAWHQLGWRAVAFSEIEKFPSAVLAHHYPDVPNLGDFTAIDTTKLGQVDILAGGTPCQAFSVAGLRQGLDDARGNLTLKFVELAHELADGNGLRNVVWENVVGVLSDKGNAFGCFLAGLVGADAPIVPPGRWTNAGMVSGPRGRAAWRVLDAQYFGVAQRRRRVIVVADFGNGADPAAVLLIEQGLPRHPPARGEAGKDVAPTISARTKGGGGLGTDFDLDGGLRVHAVDVAPCLRAGGNKTGGDRPPGTDVDTADSLIAYAPEFARCDATREGSSQDYETTTMVAIGVTGTTSHALTAEGADASEDGTGRGTPVVCVHADAVGRTGDALTPSVDAAGVSRIRPPGIGVIANGTSYNLMASGRPHAITVAIRGRDGGATAELGGEVATALRASQGGGDKPHVLSGAFATSAVRRLTPLECERLQGFPELRKTLYIQAWKQHSFDHHQSDANAGIQSRKSPKSALSADASVSTFNAQNAELRSSASHHACAKHADVHVLINFERNDLRLHSPKNSNWSVNIAEHQNSSLLCMPAGDFARLIAHIFTIQEKIIQAGRVGSLTSISSSSRRPSGNPHSVRYGRESSASASDAALFMKALDAFMKSITSSHGLEIDTLQQRLQTSLSFATNAISSCIPATMLTGNSFYLTIEGVRGYTNIPWRNSHVSPDGPRYKALGNSWAVPKFVWLGKRIAQFMPPVARQQAATEKPAAANDNDITLAVDAA